MKNNAKRQALASCWWSAIKTVGQPQRYKSGRGQPHSKTCRIFVSSGSARSVLECGCPLPLWLTPRRVTDGFNRTHLFPMHANHGKELANA